MTNPSAASTVPADLLLQNRITLIVSAARAGNLIAADILIAECAFGGDRDEAILAIVRSIEHEKLDSGWVIRTMNASRGAVRDALAMIIIRRVAPRRPDFIAYMYGDGISVENLVAGLSDEGLRQEAVILLLESYAEGGSYIAYAHALRYLRSPIAAAQADAVFAAVQA